MIRSVLQKANSRFHDNKKQMAAKGTNFAQQQYRQSENSKNLNGTRELSIIQTSVARWSIRRPLAASVPKGMIVDTPKAEHGLFFTVVF